MNEQRTLELCKLLDEARELLAKASGHAVATSVSETYADMAYELRVMISEAKKLQNR